MKAKILATLGFLALSLVTAQAQQMQGGGYFPQQGGFPQAQGGFGGYGGFGQYGGDTFGQSAGSLPYAPNAYNRANQPLSPYLNLLRGSNPAANYFYGVRPGTTGGGFGAPGGFANVAAGGFRPAFFPQQFQPDALADVDSPGRILPPAGHPVVFNNTLGYFPNPYMRGRSGMRPGMMGMGNQTQQGSTPAPKK